MAYLVTDEHERSTGRPWEYEHHTVRDLSVQIEELTGMDEIDSDEAAQEIQDEIVANDNDQFEWKWTDPEDGNHVVTVRKAS